MKNRVIAVAAFLALPGCLRQQDDGAARHEAALGERQEREEDGVEALQGEGGWAVPRETFARGADQGVDDPVPPDCGPDDVDGCRPRPVDVDGDGVRAELDCDDLDATVSPLAHETHCNGLDENCNGVDDCDSDHDGFHDADDPHPRQADLTPSGQSDPHRWP